jgi:hypothetical protein
MKHFAMTSATVLAGLLLVPAAYSQSNQVLQGTQIKLTLLDGLSTKVAHDGDPFLATVSEPVYSGGQLVLPAGAKVRGQIGSIIHTKHFGILRSQAAMNLTFRTLEFDGREVPTQMSILGIYRDVETGSRARHDIRTQEGAVVQEKRDVRGTALDLAIGTGGGSAIGAIFSHVFRGFAIGLVGSTVYVLQKKGKDVELPAQTGILVRLDSPLTLPATVSSSGAYSGDLTRSIAATINRAL